jgi:NAD(P)-dependent dehydrogenase (short-subunit alcohol dehydrogenase family)
MTPSPAHPVLLVTGGGRGIGAATARLAAQRGYAVAINYAHQAAAAEQLVADIQALGGLALAVQADISDETQVLRLFATVDAQLGPLRALVNNAGVVDVTARVDSMDAARLQRMFGVNVIGSFLCAREAVRRMGTRQGERNFGPGYGQGGAIVNVSSAASRLGSPGQYVDYAASKGAIDTMTIGLAKEVADEGIRVNAVRPGIIRTEIHLASGDPARVERIGAAAPLGRPGEAEEVARAILWLASDEASYLSGALVDVSGGR